MKDRRLKIAIIEPFYGGSHQQWAAGWQKNSRHSIDLYTLPASHWKWRMHGGSITLAQQLLAESAPDIIVASDMTDLTTLGAIVRKKWPNIPIVLYFHENQLTNPWSAKDRDTNNQRDRHYMFINYASALVADHIYFNSHYHQRSFLEALPAFLRAFPDRQELHTVETIAAKSEVLPLGLSLKDMDSIKAATPQRPERAVLLWNHRWEYDKNPEEWYAALTTLRDRGIEFRLIVTGESYREYPPVFDQIAETFADQLLHMGYASSRKDYYRLLCLADIAPVTSRHDFFGVSVVEAMYANTIPLLPHRLAYPEHIPNAYHGAFFYKDHRDFVNFLQRQILNVRLLRKQRTDHFVERYDWQHMAPVYDDKMEKLIS